MTNAIKAIPGCFFAIFILILYSCNSSVKQNHLSNASSPYLQEHADNPVDWYEWGDEALAKARKENKPLLISIGYASCHWCHEMERESFMDTSVARIMNENFVNIKVDREERPDIDNIYMKACQLLTGDNGGWPLNAFALPDGKPFFAGTYYSKQGWKNLLLDVANAYKTKNELVIKQAASLLNGMVSDEISFINSGQKGISGNSYDDLFDSIYIKGDLEYGGLKGAPKFPTPAFTKFLLQHYYLSGDKKALDLATLTLNKMALGGIYDQVGGGFARYTTDIYWHVPHFEKMLYDNAQLISVYAHAYQLTGDEFYKTILSETISFVEENLSSPVGGWFSSLNADTKEGEGKFYTWSKEEFQKIAGSAEWLEEYYHVSEKGNWEENSNILYADEKPEKFAAANHLDSGMVLNKIRQVKKLLYAERNKREKPKADDKILTAWNCIMIKAYADAYAATGNQKYLEKARSGALFIQQNMLSGEGNLKRNFKNGKATIDGFLDDYAWAVTAYIRLYEVSFDTHWIEIAKRIAEKAIHNFYDNKSGLFYYSDTGKDKLVMNKIQVADDAIPSSNAMMADALYSLGIIYEDTLYNDISLKMFTSVSGRIEKLPRYHIQWCKLAGRLSGRSFEVAIMGNDAMAKNYQIQKEYLPTSIIMGSINDEGLPFLRKKLEKGKTVIYVCTNKVCKRPVENVYEAIAQLK